MLSKVSLCCCVCKNCGQSWTCCHCFSGRLACSFPALSKVQEKHAPCVHTGKGAPHLTHTQTPFCFLGHKSGRKLNDLHWSERHKLTLTSRWSCEVHDPRSVPACWLTKRLSIWEPRIWKQPLRLFIRSVCWVCSSNTEKIILLLTVGAQITAIIDKIQQWLYALIKKVYNP